MQIKNRILYLCDDPGLLRLQLRGVQLDQPGPARLAENVSTDEIAPAWASYYFDQTLARYCLTGFRGGVIGRDVLRNAAFSVLVAGAGFGCGSSRETAPYSQLAAGLSLIVAKSFAKIYRQNCQNLGLYTSTDFGLLSLIEEGRPIDVEQLVGDADDVSRKVIVCGGLCAFNRRRLSGEITLPQRQDEVRPMTIVEKILAGHVVGGTLSEPVGAASTRPGESLFVRTDVRFTHDYVTAMADAQFRQGFGQQAGVFEPQSVFAFSDHLTLVDEVMPDQQRRLGLADQVLALREGQRRFAERHGVVHYAEREISGRGRVSEGICHNKVIEDLALPGQVIVGTDSHTCMAGVLGCVAFGVGSTDMANAWYTGDVRVTVPETVSVELSGSLSKDVCAKDLMLQLLSSEFFRTGQALGKALQFSGDGFLGLALDERATLTNMAAEAGAFAAIGPVDDKVLDYLSERRPFSKIDLLERAFHADPDATYAARLEVELSGVCQMVAEPADPSRGVALAALLAQDREIPIDIAYGGSCTGGKKRDMDMYARVIADALKRGRRVAESVRFFVQFGSQEIRNYAKQRGYLELFERAGVHLLEPACGACIRAGPGISSNSEQITVSAVNRNFEGRSGPGRVYLASPLVVAASAIAGKLASPTSATLP